MALIIVSCIVLGGLIGYVFWLLSKEEKIDFVYLKSELADPKVNILPYGFYASHYRILGRIAYFSWFWTPEFFYTQINQWEKQWSRRASDLANMWYLDVRTERNW